METLLEQEPVHLPSGTALVDASESRLREEIQKHMHTEADVHQSLITNPEKIKPDSRNELVRTIQSCRVGRRALEQEVNARELLRPEDIGQKELF